MAADNMALPINPSSLFNALEKDVLSFEKIKELIEKYPSHINKTDDSHETPLIKILKNKTCLVDMVKHLLQGGSEVNPDQLKPSPLSTALRHSRDKDIVKVLLEAGADVNLIDNTRQTPLCIALENNNSKDIVELFLEAKCDLEACLVHNTILHCATDSVRLHGLKKDILKLLLEAGADINDTDDEGRSSLCYALGRRAKVDDIKMMIKLGASLYDCKMHNDPIVCAVEPGFSRCPSFKRDMIIFLRDSGVSIDNVNGGFYKPMKHALWDTTYDTEAIELLLDISGMGADAVSEENETLLHFAMHNRFYYNIGTIEMLVDRGVPINVVDSSGEVPLHVAVKNRHISESVIKILIKNGADVDAKDKNGSTPLRLAVINERDTSVIKELLVAGAGIDEEQKNCKWDYLLRVLLERYTHETPRACVATSDLLMLARTNPDVAEFTRKTNARMALIDVNDPNPVFETFRDSLSMLGPPIVDIPDFQRHQDALEDIRMFLKLYLLLDPHFNYEDLIEVYRGCEIFLDFSEECLYELIQMESVYVGHSRSLRRFASCLSETNNYDFDELMSVMADNKFPIYLDIILDKVGRSTLKMKAQNWMQAERYCPDSDCEIESISLDYDSLCKVSKYLFGEDLLLLLLAFFNPKDPADCEI